MVVEIISSKLIAPYHGTTVLVWALILSFTLIGIAIGYFIGGILSTKENKQKILFTSTLLSSALVFCMSPLSKSILGLTYDLPLVIAIGISLLIFLVPTLILFGCVSPIIIKLLAEAKERAGWSSGMVYGVSTLGGIIGTLLFGIYGISFIGIRNCLFLIALMLFCSAWLMYPKMNIQYKKGN